MWTLELSKKRYLYTSCWGKSSSQRRFSLPTLNAGEKFSYLKNSAKTTFQAVSDIMIPLSRLLKMSALLKLDKTSSWRAKWNKSRKVRIFQTSYSAIIKSLINRRIGNSCMRWKRIRIKWSYIVKITWDYRGVNISVLAIFSKTSTKSLMKNTRSLSIWSTVFLRKLTRKWKSSCFLRVSFSPNWFIWKILAKVR